MLMEAIARRRRVARFSPLSLFAAGEQGILIDPSDLSTLFTDVAGTTPVTAPGQTVALALDKSRGLALGPELVTTQNLTNPAWVSGGAFGNYAGSTATADTITSTGVSGSRRFRFACVPGQTFRASTLATRLAGSATNANIEVAFGTSGATLIGAPLAASGALVVGQTTPLTITAIAPSTAAFCEIIIRASGPSGSQASFSNISIRELPGNHLTQATLTFRPAYQATPRRLAFDGGDDRLNSTYAPRVTGSYAVRFNGSTAGRVAIGSQGATDGRAFLGLAADGSIAAGIGAQSITTIKGTADVRNTWVTGAVTWNGTTVRLYQDGVEVYSGAQSGAVNTTIPIDLGALNNNSTRAAFWAGSIGAAVAIDRALTPAEIANLHNFWRTIA